MCPAASAGEERQGAPGLTEHLRKPFRRPASIANPPSQAAPLGTRHANGILFSTQFIIDSVTGAVVSLVHLIANPVPLLLHTVLYLMNTFVGTVLPLLTFLLHAVLHMLNLLSCDMPCVACLVGQLVGRLSPTLF